MLPYEQEYSWGTFPVLFGDGICRTRSADDVTVVPAEGDPVLSPHDFRAHAVTDPGDVGLQRP